MKAIINGIVCAIFMLLWCLGNPWGIIMLFVIPIFALSPNLTIAELGFMAWAPAIPLVLIPWACLAERRANASSLPTARLIPRPASVRR